MEYPGNFDTPAYPAGKSIAISRFMAIATFVSFLLIVFLCGILIWSARSDKLIPYIVSTNSNTGEWKIVGKTGDGFKYSAERTMQESLIGNFVQDWFKISINKDENEAAWKHCDRTTCGTGDSLMFGTRMCAIYCSAGDELYSRFSYEILPAHRAKANNGEVWTLDDKNMIISPAGKISEQGGTWQVTATVSSNIRESFEIRVYMKVARNKNYYPQTLGFYVADFNSYRI